MNQNLLRRCFACIGSQLDTHEAVVLQRWAEDWSAATAAAVAALLARPAREWQMIVCNHPAHRHPWFDWLAREASIRDFAVYFDENWAEPRSLPLLVRVRDAQTCEEARAAIDRNIADEQRPVPHANLLRRLMVAVHAKAGGEMRPPLYPSLVDRTLAFYYGYYCDPWHLVGMLFATEVMSRHRIAQMGAGLERLGIAAADRELVAVHLACSDAHTAGWRDGVVVPSVRSRGLVRASIAAGIALCVATSACYLDELLMRAREEGEVTA